jgi:Putative transposase
MEDGHVRFRYKDYRANRPDSQKTMTLAATEFIRRFLLHVLPPGFHRIRYYGLLGNRHRTANLAQCRQLLGTTCPKTISHTSSPAQDYRDRYEILTGTSLRTCPVCGAGRMRLIEQMSRLRLCPPITDSS